MFVFEVSDESFEFRLLAQALEMRIDSEERPAGESGIDAALEPLHCLVRFAQGGMHARDLIVGVVSVAEGASGIQRLSHALKSKLALTPSSV